MTWLHNSSGMLCLLHGEQSDLNSGFPSTIKHPHPPKFDSEWCKFRFIRNLYIIPSDTSRLEGLIRILQQKVA